MRHLLPTLLLLLAACGGGGSGSSDGDFAPEFATVSLQQPWDDYATEGGGFGVRNYSPDVVYRVGFATESYAPVSWLATPTLWNGDDFEWASPVPIGLIYVVARGTSGREYRALVNRVLGISEGWTVTNNDLWFP